jgi:hypothetical protein
MKPNYTILFFAFLYGLIETTYFGWNFSPSSDAEVICDGITMLIGAMAFLGTNIKAP